MKPFLFACVLLLLATAASATTYTVDPDGTGDFPNIQAAIAGCVDGDIVELTDGTFTGDGNRDITFLGKAVVIESLSGNPESCTIDVQGDSVQPRRGFLFNSGEGPDAILRNVTITGGYATAALPGGAHGGGCLIEGGSSPTLEDCVFELNTAISDGGAIGVSQQSSPSVTRCTFQENQSYNAGGGGAIDEGSQPTFEDCDFIENTAPSAGAIFVASATGVGTFEECRFTRNSSTSADPGNGAGALWAGAAGTALLADCTFDGNGAQRAAGAIGIGHAQAPQGTVTAERCLFIRNHAEESSGVIGVGNAGVATLTECSFYLNTAGIGSAVAGVSSAGSVSLISCTLAGNGSPGATLGIGAADAQILLENTIVAFSTQGAAASGEPNYTLSCCDIIGNTGGDYVGPIAGMLGTNDNMSENPLFCSIPDHDYTLADSSACAPDNSGGCGLIGAWSVACPFATTGVPDQTQTPLPRALLQNHPNPFNPSTTITYMLPAPGRVTLTIHDIAGRRMRTLQSATLAASGQHDVVWDGRDDRGQAVGSGVYYYRIDAGEWSESRSMVLLK